MFGSWRSSPSSFTASRQVAIGVKCLLCRGYSQDETVDEITGNLREAIVGVLEV
jgi:hypothetical protein